MSKFKLSLLMIIIISQVLFSARKLDFTKQRYYSFGSGEYSRMFLELESYNTYNYEGGIKAPFVLKKLSNGNLEIIFDMRTVADADLEVDRTYKQSFVFTKKNIGKQERLYLSATYKPEIRFVINDSLHTDFVHLTFTPGKTSEMVFINSNKNFTTPFIINEDPDVSVTSDTGLRFTKGSSSIEVSLINEGNFNKELMLYRKIKEGKINQLYIYITAEGFEKIKEEPINEEVVDDSLSVAAGTDSGIPGEEGVNGEVYENSLPNETVSEGGFGIMAIIIIVVMAIMIIILLILLLAAKNNSLMDKYQTFFDDVATLVKVEIKGSNIDRSIEEIMMILLEKFEFSNEEEKPVSKKKLKKPANLKSRGLNQDDQKEKEEPLDINLDFGNEGSEEKQDEPKPDVEKKITRGFDFLDDEN